MRGCAGPSLSSRRACGKSGRKVSGVSLLGDSVLSELFPASVYPLLCFILLKPRNLKTNTFHHRSPLHSLSQHFPSHWFQVLKGQSGDPPREEAAFFYPVSPLHLPLTEFNSVPRSLSPWFLNFLPGRQGSYGNSFQVRVGEFRRKVD